VPDVRVLGIDPGTRVLGFGVIEQRGNELRAVTHGTVNPRPSLSLAERLDLLFTGINTVLESARPDAVAVEGVFSHRNAHSALILGHARGVALLCAARMGLPVFEYAPAQVKRAVGASGAAEKQQVLRLIRGYLGLQALEKVDAADALALALCHLNRSRFAARIVPGRQVG
jgi:crossover junction endodeoxyribonuclease RuvC